MKRRLEYDVIRIFSCFTILIIHYNTTVCGWNNNQFVYNNSLIPNYFFDCIYLGEIGNSLFFILSGASLLCNVNYYNITRNNIFEFYWKRLFILLPTFYVVFFSATFIQLVLYRSIYNGSITNLIQTVVGIDGYALDRHWVDSNFYQVGEWFLGCIILCYAIWPIVTYIWRKIPAWIFVLLVITMYIISVEMGNDRFISVRVTQMIAGAAFSFYDVNPLDKRIVGPSLAIGLAGVTFRNYIHPITVSFAFCWMIFIGITIIFRYYETYLDKIKGYIVEISSATYPAFLIHHKLIFILTYGMDFSNLQYRHVVILFIGYVIITFWLSFKLLSFMKRLTPMLTRITDNKIYKECFCTMIGMMLFLVIIQAFI